MLHAVRPSQIVAAVVCLIVTSAVPAQERALRGVYSTSLDQSDRIDAAIEKAVAEMNFIKRPIARGRLKKTNPSYNRISISSSVTEIRVQFENRKPVQMPADGSAIKWMREDGEVFEVSANWRQDELVQTFTAEDGQRVNRFHLGPDGTTLLLQVTVSSPQLSVPVEYTLEYRKIENDEVMQ